MSLYLLSTPLRCYSASQKLHLVILMRSTWRLYPEGVPTAHSDATEHVLETARCRRLQAQTCSLLSAMTSAQSHSEILDSLVVAGSVTPSC